MLISKLQVMFVEQQTTLPYKLRQRDGKMRNVKITETYYSTTTENELIIFIPNIKRHLFGFPPSIVLFRYYILISQRKMKTMKISSTS